MSQLTNDKPRRYSVDTDVFSNEIPVSAATTIYEGSAIGDTGGAGTARQLQDGDTFLGFAAQKIANTGSAGDKSIKVIEEGRVQLSVTGVTGYTDIGAVVNASDGNTFTMDGNHDSAIGKITQFVGGTTVWVYFRANQVSL